MIQRLEQQMEEALLFHLLLTNHEARILKRD